MEPVTVLAIIACVTFALGSLAGYRVGYGKGRVDGTIIAMKELKRGND